MKTGSGIVGVVLALVALSAHGQAKDCAELKAEIAAKMDANGVVGYRLTVIEAGATPAGTIVGGCGGGRSQIDYVRGGAAAASADSSNDAEPPEVAPDPLPTMAPEGEE